MVKIARLFILSLYNKNNYVVGLDMNIVLILISILFSLFSTTVMLYISMATPIGPWIAPTLVLIASLLFRVSKNNFSSNVIYVVSAGSIGGILATALGFSFPTIFFLEPLYFNTMLIQQSWWLITIISGMSLIAGLMAFIFVNHFEDSFLHEQKLPFPIGELVFKMVNAQQSFKQSLYMLIGMFSTAVFCVLQDGLFFIKSFIPKAILLLPFGRFYFLSIPNIWFDFFPLCWAIGYVTGAVIALPLMAGGLTKLFIADPLNHTFFSAIGSIEFMLAFCSGLVLYSAVTGFFSTLPSFKKYINVGHYVKGRSEYARNINAQRIFNKLYVLPLCLFIVSLVFFSFLKFNLVAQLYLFTFTLICAYQVVVIAGKIGLAQLGRFATFVMIPGMLLFRLNPLQITIVATFVELCAGIATDLMFSRKLGELAVIESKRMKHYQLLGIVVSALASGVIFYLIASNIVIGSDILFAQRAQGRALLVNFGSFNYQVMLIGFVYGYVLKLLKLNPMLVLGGILMPLNITISLLTGALLEKLLSKRIDLQPFWSGVFATQSIWILLRALI